MRKYIFFTIDALKQLTANRFFQSKEFPQAQDLLKFIKGESDFWREGNIMACLTKSGVVILSEKNEKNFGLLFDLTSFKAFNEESDDNILLILSKTFRYAIKYFLKFPFSRNEKEIPGTAKSIVYPYSFVARKNVGKVILDRNSSKHARKGKDFLIAYYYGTEGENHEVSFTSLNKLIEEYGDVVYVKEKPKVSETGYISPVIDLCNISLTIDAAIGLENWNQYLTAPQREFINRPVSGAERLEGAAGTGKTLTLVLRCIKLLQEAKKQNNSLNLIFFTHSISTKDRILDVFKRNWTEIDAHLETNERRPDVSLLVTTLQEWSMRHLGINSLNENEYLDKDASDSKIYQLMYIEQACQRFRNNYFPMYEKKLSESFRQFLKSDPIDFQLELLQKEISEIIKGQCSSILDRYLKIERPKYGLKLENDYDKRYVYGIFDEYQNSLMDVGQYDSDDIVLTALGQVDSPIWNRRRAREGYDACFIDETHLFNLNELSLFHHVNKPSAKNNLIYAIDRSQSIGENYRADETIKSDNEQSPTLNKYTTVFRNMPEIATLAYEILSSGATLFTNMENPLENSTFTFTENDEAKSRFPQYINVVDEDQLFIKAFECAHTYCNETGCQKSNVLIIASNDSLLRQMQKFADSKHKPFVTLRSRSDNSTLKEANEWNKYVLSGIDYVGGLEFDYVILVGADKECIPPRMASSSAHVLKYAWYNRLYVAVTRAKYAITFLGVQSKGISDLLSTAISNQCLSVDI